MKRKLGIRWYGIFAGNVMAFSLGAQTGPAGVGTPANNVLWLKADAGTSTTTDGIALSSWNDQSGNGVNVTQSVAVQRPVYRATLMNGMPAIEFDNNNTAGQNDFLTAPDNTILDNTAGYTFFTVTRMKTLDGNARCVVSKRTSIDVDEAFMLFYYTSNYFHLDIDGLGNRFSTNPTTYSINTNYIIDAVFDGSLPVANRSKIYEEETLRAMATETSTTVGDKPSPLMIGATHSGDNRPFGGYMSEVIIYRTALNDASRIIINNYLSAKYNVPLSANNRYSGDDPANGNYDRLVSGVGQDVSGSNTAFSASTTAGLGLSVNTGLDNGDYLLVGHASTTNAQITYDVAGMTGIMNARWLRIWYADVTNTSTVLNTNVEFDISDGGLGSVSLGAVSDYVLLYRPGLTGAWTELVTASAITGDKIQFNGFNFVNDGYYTVGTRNYPVSPLPVELLEFNAKLNDDQVNLNWSTASETNNAFFTVERSADGLTWKKILQVNGAGNSNQLLTYTGIDKDPLAGTNYYRLKQTDTDGAFTYSDIKVVQNDNLEAGIDIYPNPSDGCSLSLSFTGFDQVDVWVIIRDLQGREYYSKVQPIRENDQVITIEMENSLAAGIYLVTASSGKTFTSRKMVVKK